MALNSYPFENANTTEDQYTLLFRNFADTGIVGNYGDSQYAVSTDGSGLDVQVAAGYAIIRGHAVQNDGPVTVTMDPADTVNPRIDIVVLRLSPDLDGISLAVVKGTPAANPTAPSLTQTEADVYELPLAQVRVNANALNVAASDVTSVRSWGSHKFGVWTTADRPVNPYIGKPGFNISLNGAEVWNGTKWESVVSKRKITVSHTFTLAGPVQVATAGGDYYIPPFFIAAPSTSEQTAKITGFRSRVWHGGSGQTNTVNWKLVKNTSTDISAVQSTTQSTGEKNGNLEVPLNHGETVGLVVTGIAGTPKNMTVTVYVEYEA